MKKYGIHMLIAIGALLMVSVGCTDKDAEKRIAELENRLRDLESSGAPATSPAVQPQAQPEVKPEGPLPVFQFEEMSHDFGTIAEGDIVSHTFKFTNTGEAPLIIQSARGSCGCTVPTWPKEPIPVGGTADITAEYNSKGKSGVENKTVTITSNTWPKTTTLRIKAQVNKAGAAGPVAK